MASFQVDGPGCAIISSPPIHGTQKRERGPASRFTWPWTLNWQCKWDTGCSGLMKPFLPRIGCRMSVSSVFITQPTGVHFGRIVHTPHVEKSYNEHVKKSIEQNNSVMNAFDLSKRGIGMGLLLQPERRSAWQVLYPDKPQAPHRCHQGHGVHRRDRARGVEELLVYYAAVSNSEVTDPSRRMSKGWNRGKGRGRQLGRESRSCHRNEGRKSQIC